MTDKNKECELGYLLMGNANPTTKLLELKVKFTEEFNKLAWAMLETGEGNIEDLVKILSDNMKLIYTEEGKTSEFSVQINS